MKKSATIEHPKASFIGLKQLALFCRSRFKNRLHYWANYPPARGRRLRRQSRLKPAIEKSTLVGFASLKPELDLGQKEFVAPGLLRVCSEEILKWLLEADDSLSEKSLQKSALQADFIRPNQMRNSYYFKVIAR